MFLSVFTLNIVLSPLSYPCRPDTSQHNIYHHVHYHIFNMKRNGTYVEIGAMGGNWLSTTLRLHTCYNWNGVLVEGSPRNCVKLHHNVYLMRFPRPKVFCGAVCDESQEHTMFTDRSGPLAGDITHMSDSFVTMHRVKAHPLVKVKCYTMSHYLKGITHVDFFSLDVEGSEFIVLKTMDFTATTVDVFVIEMDEHNHTKNLDITRFLVLRGYIQCHPYGHIGKNAVFAYKDAVDAHRVTCTQL